MKVVILAGGAGTRLSEETDIKPKPLVEIGGKPILWHIMKIYSSFGFNDFVICLGYKGYLIKEYFSNYFLHQSDIIIDMKNNKTQYLNSNAEPWTVSLIDTGLETMTGGRIKRIKNYVNNETFMLTYGDGVAGIDINALVNFHKADNKILTITAVQPTGRFGALEIDNSNTVTSFKEKPRGDGSWINGGFFVCEPGIFDFIEADSSIWERKPLETISSLGQLSAFKHEGFWRPMDTLRDKRELEELWDNNKAPWKMWDNS